MYFINYLNLLKYIFFKFYFIKGIGYTREVDNDILLLDISNDDEYVWTTSFVPSLTSQTPTTDPTLTPSTPSSPSNTIGIAIGTSIGIIGGIALIVGSFFLYKRYKNRSERRIPMLTPEIQEI
jgi:hypothetical protein